MYLWGAHFSPELSSQSAENAILSRAIGLLQTQNIASQSLQHGLQLIQAEILLATFMFAVGAGSLETDYRVGAAVRLALGFGMNRISRGPSGNVYEKERIAMFWRVFCLDRMWAISNGKPANMTIRGSSRTTITTPWPQSPDEYGQVSNPCSLKLIDYQFLQGPPPNTVEEQVLRKFLEEGGNSTSGFSYPSLFVKSTFLCEHAAQHASLPSSSESDTL